MNEEFPITLSFKVTAYDADELEQLVAQTKNGTRSNVLRELFRIGMRTHKQTNEQQTNNDTYDQPQ